VGGGLPLNREELSLFFLFSTYPKYKKATTMSTAGTKKRYQRSAAEQKAYKARQMAAMRDLAALRRDPVALAQVIGTNTIKPFRMQHFQGSGEIKSLDITSAQYGISTTATITPLNLIRAGSSFFNRIGRKVEFKSLHLKCFLTAVRTAGFDYARIMVVYDSQTNGTLPAISDILQDCDQAGTNTTNSLASANLNNRDRFRIIMDERVVLPAVTVTAGVVTAEGSPDPIKKFIDLDRFIPLKGYTTQYKADSSPAVTGDIATGGLYFVTLGAQASGSEGYNAYMSSRLRYMDR